MHRGGWRAAVLANALLGMSVPCIRPALADCGFCEIATAQDVGFALGDRFQKVMLRQVEQARRGVDNGSFTSRRRPDPPGSEGLDGLTPLLWATRSAGESGWAFWATGFGGAGARGDSTIADSVGQRIRIAGVVSGFDHRLSDNVLIGAAVAYGSSGYDVDGRVSSASARSALLGLYGSWSGSNVYADAALSFAVNDVATLRIVAAPASERADGAFASRQFGARFEAGWRALELPAVVTPVVGLSVQHLRQDAYAERSPGTLALAVAGQNPWSVRSELGVTLASWWVLDIFALLTPRLRVAWAHEFSAARGVMTSQGSVPNARAARDALLVSLGAQRLIGEKIHLFAQFDGEWSAGRHLFVGSGGLRVKW